MRLLVAWESKIAQLQNAQLCTLSARTDEEWLRISEDRETFNSMWLKRTTKSAIIPHIAHIAHTWPNGSRESMSASCCAGWRW